MQNRILTPSDMQRAPNKDALKLEAWRTASMACETVAAYYDKAGDPVKAKTFWMQAAKWGEKFVDYYTSVIVPKAEKGEL